MHALIESCQKRNDAKHMHRLELGSIEYFQTQLYAMLVLMHMFAIAQNSSCPRGPKYPVLTSDKH